MVTLEGRVQFERANVKENEKRGIGPCVILNAV